MSYYDYMSGNIMPGSPAPMPNQAWNAYPQPQQNCQCDNRFMWIQGKEAAKAYPVAPDKTIFFLDDKDSYAYLKKTDRDGKTVEFKTFQLIEEIEPDPTPNQSIGNAVSREEFNVFSKNIDSSLNELKEMILATQRHNKPTPQKRQVRDDV